MWLLALCGCCSLCFPIPSFSQTLVHPEKVVVRPRGTGPADALTVNGGIRGGNGGSVQIVNADGTISAATAIGPGTVTFNLWADNDCTDGEIAQWVNSTLKWECSGIAAVGGASPTANEVITGSWEFRNPILFGDDTTASQLVHLYKATSQVGVRLQRGNGKTWDLLGNTNLTVVNASDNVTVATFVPTGGFTFGAANETNSISGNTTHTGNLTLNGSLNSHFTPVLPDTWDLGSPLKLWRQSFISQMNALVFAKQTISLYGGHLMVTHNAGTLKAALSSGENQATFGQEMVPGDFIELRGQTTEGGYSVEYLLVGAEVIGTPTWRYAVTRNLDSTGEDNWPDGTPYAVNGASGDGRIELNANARVVGDPTAPYMSILTQGSTYNGKTELIRLGSLDSFYTVPAGKYGLAIGNPAQNSLTFYDGVLTIRGNGNGLTQINGGEITTGSVRAGSIYANDITANEIASNAITSDEISSTSAIYIGPSKTWGSNGIQLEHNSGNPRFRVGADGATTNFLKYEGGALTLRGALTANDITSGGTITGSTVQTGSTGARVVLNTDPSLKWFDSGGGEIGSIDSTGVKVKISPSGFSSTAAYNFTGWSQFSGVPTWAALSASEWGGGPEQTLSLGLGTSGTTTPTKMVLNLGTISGSSYAANIIMTAQHNSTADIQFNANTSSFFINGSTLMSLTSNGRVGIGTTAPSAPLTVSRNTGTPVASTTALAQFFGADDASTPSVQIYSPGTNRTGLFRGYANRNTLASPQATQSGDEVVGFNGVGHDGTDYVSLGSMFVFADENISATNQGSGFKWFGRTTGGTTWGEKMRLTGLGALLIGTTTVTSGYELDVNGDAYIRTSLSVGSSTGTQTWDSGTTQHKFSHDVQAPGFMLNNWSQTTSGWNVVCTGAAAAGADHWLYYGFSSSSCSSSSIRYKTAVQPAQFDFSRILDVTPVTFEYKTSPEVPQFGVIAEVLESLGLEPLVVRDNAGMVNAVNYDKVALYLIPVVKEQRERIVSLEERLAALEALVAVQHPRPDPAAIYPVLQACTTGVPPVCH